MLCGCCGDRWPIRCLMADEVERGFYDVKLFHSLFIQFINLVIFNNVCVGFDFADGDIVVGGFLLCLPFRLCRASMGGLCWDDGSLMWLRRK